jgi:hypothetical protein
MYKKLFYLIPFILMLSIVDNASADLIAQWRLDEGAGNITKDYVGGYDGTLIGDTSWVAGQLDGALLFDGAGDYVDCGNDPIFNPQGSFSATIWAYITDWSTGWGHSMFSKGGDHDRGGWVVRRYETEVIVFTGAGFTATGQDEDHNLSGNTAPPLDEWVHIACVYDFEGGIAYIYINGVADAIIPASGTIEENDASVYIGTRSNIDGTGPDDWDASYFNGMLDDARFYDHALSEADVALIMQGKGAQPLTMALNPIPNNGGIEVPRDVVLSWKAGDNAATHDVYFGTDFDDVNEASRENDPNAVLVSQNQDATTYDPNGLLDYNTTYYWRVDEFNDVHPNSPWRGNVWSFTVRNYIIVDDFEDYNDYEPDRIFDMWIDGWSISENGSQVGNSTPPFAEQEIVHSGDQSMPFFYTNTDGVAYSEAVRTFDTPQNWAIDDVEKLTLFFRGYPTAFEEDPPGTYTMTASGTDVWDESDEFRFAYKMLSGNGSISARVVSVENTHAFAKAGVMIRETLEPFSVHGFMFITPDGRRCFQNRTTTAWESYSAHSEPNAVSLPGWVKLERQGIFVTAYYSEDGVNWTQQPDDENTESDASTNPRIIVMRSDIYVGFAHTSHYAGTSGISVFSDVTTTGTVTGDDWEVKAIGVEMPANGTQPLYVAVEGGGTAKVVEHPDNPNAVLATDWQQWDIPLSVLSDAGVDLTAVEKMTVGVGSQTEPQDGEGRLYFDDIRLYRPTPSEPNEPSDPNAPSEIGV